MATKAGVVLSARKEQAAAGTDKDSNSNLIHSVSAMLSSNDLKTPTTDTLKDWMVETTKNIKEEKFWLLNEIKIPAEHLVELCPHGNHNWMVVFLLTLWARFSPCCHEAITRCLTTGAELWKEGTWWLHLHAFVLSIRVHVWHTLPQLEAQEKENTVTQSGHSILHLEAHCLNQAVVNSSKMFSMLVNQNPWTLVLRFHKYLKRMEPKSKFHKKLNEFNFDYKDEDKESVTHVSIADVVYGNIVLNLREVLALEEMKQLYSGLRNSQVVIHENLTEAQYSKISQDIFAELNGLSTTVLEKLGVDPDTNDFVPARLLGFAIYAEGFSKRWGGTYDLEDGSSDQIFMIRLFQACILGKEKKTALKNLVEDKHPPLFDIETVLTLIHSRMAKNENVGEPGQQKTEKRGQDDKDAGDKKLRENSREQSNGNKGTGPFKKRKNTLDFTRDNIC